MKGAPDLLRQLLRRLTVLAVITCAVLVLPSMTAMAKGTASDDGPNAGYEDDTVLVGFQPGTSDREKDGVVRAEHGSQKEVIGAGTHVIKVAKGSVASSVKAFKKHGSVRYAEPNSLLHASYVPPLPTAPRFGELWGLQNTGQLVGGSYYPNQGTPGADISATSAWDITTGTQSVVIGVVDTGIDYNHPNLAPNVWTNDRTINEGSTSCGPGTRGYNAITNSCDPMDDHSHGTHVSGTIGAAANGTGVVGVNLTTSIMGLKFLDSTGSGTGVNEIKAIDFAVQAKRAGVNVRALNASYGRGCSNFYQCFSQAELDEITLAGQNDILFVAAAGNNSFNHASWWGFPCDLNYDWGSPGVPGPYVPAPNMICVAATDQNDNLATFSDYGPGVNIAAPGTNVLSTVPGGGYAYFNGTSMATPHVTGSAGLILSACTLTVAQLRAAIVNNGDLKPNLPVDSQSRLNVYNAILSCLPPPPVP